MLRDWRSPLLGLRQPHLSALAAMLGVAALHTILVWGYTPVFWGDVGVQLHHIERVAGGELPYRDFHLTSPPLGLWIVGSLAGWVGTDLTPVWTVTTLLFLAIVVATWAYADALIPRQHRLWGGVVAVVFAVSFVQVGGAALPFGTYYLSASVGFLCLITAAALVIRSLDGLTLARALLSGLFAGLCIVSKQDFWAPALVLVGITSLSLWVRGKEYRGRSLAVLVGFLVAVAGGVALIAATSGWEAVPQVVTGYGAASMYGISRSLPSWRRLTVEVFALGLLGAATAAALAAAGGGTRKARAAAVFLIVATIAAGLYVLMGMKTGFRVRANGLGEWPNALEAATVHGTTTLGLGRIVVEQLLDEWTLRFFPMLLPFAAAALVFLRRESVTKNQLLLLLGLLAFCAAARLRRGFEWAEWFHFLLELPVYTLMLHWLYGDRGDRALRILMPALLVAGVYFHWALGWGPLTQRGTLPAVETPRGTVHWLPNEAEDFKRIKGLLDELDPSGMRPVVSFGQNGGFAYFLERPNPTSLSFGITLSTVPPEEAVRNIRELDPAPFLIYTRAYERAGVPVSEWDLDRWTLRLRGNHYATDDVPFFRKAAAGCDKVPLEGTSFFVIFDCEARSVE